MSQISANDLSTMVSYIATQQAPAVSHEESLRTLANRQSDIVVQAQPGLLDQSILAFAAQAGAASTVQSPASIAALALALRNDLDLIYFHVRNQIEYHPMHGVSKGSLPTLIDGISGPFDQCSLMVDLLRQAGYTANFMFGEIDLSAAEIAAWLGTDTSGTSAANISIARDVLANGGIPCTIYDSGGGVWRINVTHIWVKVYAGGQTYQFDPSYKTYTDVAGINLATATGYSQATLLSDAGVGATIDASGNWIQSVNNTNIRADLNTYAANLINWIKTNNPTATLEDVVGGRRIVEVNTPVRQTSLPYLKAGSTPTEWTSIPDTYRITIRFRYPGIDVTKFGDEIYSKRLTMFFNASVQAELRLDGTLLATSTAQSLNSYQSLQITVTHPYAVTTFNTDGFERIEAPYSSTDKPYYLIPCLIGPTRKGMSDYHYQKLASNEFAGGSSLSEPILGERLFVIAHTLQSNNSCFEMLGRLAKVGVTMHHALGTCYLQDFPSSGKQYVNYSSAQNALFAVTALDGNSTDLHRFGQATGMHGYTGEMVALQQVLGTNGASATRVLDVANANGTRIYKGTNSNWSTVVSPNLSLYAIDLSSIPTYLAANSGSFVLIPKTGDQTYNSMNIEGYVLNSVTFSGAAIGILGANFGGLAPNGPIVPPGKKDCEEEESDPVKVRTGDYLYRQTDLSIGSGGYPYELSFDVRYDSSERLTSGPLGLGWSHNWQTFAVERSDGFKGILGVESPIDAAATIVECFVALDLLIDTAPSILKMMTASLANSWWADQVTRNTVEVKFEEEIVTFTKLPSGAYNPPQGNADTLIKNVNGTFTHKTPQGVTRNFNSDGTLSTIVFPNGVTITLGYTSGKLTSVSNGMGRTLTLSYTGSKITSVTDGTGRSVQYSFDGNNQLTAIKDALLNDTTFQYDQPGRMTKYFLPENPTVAMVTNSYDSLNRVASQLDMYGRWIARVESSKITVGGTITAGNVVTLTVIAPSLPSGQRSVSYALIGTDTTTTVATALKNAVNADSTLSALGVTATSSLAVISMSSLTGRATYALSTSIAATVTLTPTATTGDIITVTVFNSALAGGQKSVSYTVTAGNTTDNIAQGLKNAVNADSSLAAIGVTASNLNGPELGRFAITSTSSNQTTYASSVSANATESVFFDAHSNFYIAGWRSEFVNALGRSKLSYFDNQDNMVKSVDELGNVTQHIFDGLGRKTEHVLPEGNRTQWTFDAKNNILTERHIAKVGSGLADIVRTMTYNPTWNRVATDQDPRGNTTSFGYDAATGNLLTITRPIVGGLTPQVVLTYNSRGQTLTRTDETGIVTKFEYNATNETLERVTQDFGTGRLNLLMLLGYSSVGDITSMTDPRGFASTSVFDAKRRATQKTDPAPFGFLTNMVFDKNDNLKRIERQTGNSSAPWQIYQATFNAANQITSLTDPAGNVASRQYNELRMLWKEVDAENRTTQYQYDRRNKLNKVIAPDSTTDQTILYSANGQKSLIVDARNNATQMTFDGFDRPDKTIYPDTTYEQNTLYDAGGNVKTYRTRSGNTVVNNFDVLNRLADKTPTGQPKVTFSYDLAGRRTKASTPVVANDPSSGDFVFDFDTAGRFYRETYPDLKQVTFQLDANGNVTRLVHPDGYFVDRIYDQLNRLTDIKLNGAATAAAHFDYDSLSRRRRLTFGNSASIDYNRRINDDLNSMINTFTGSNAIITYRFNKEHEMVSRKTNDPLLRWTPPSTGTSTYGTANGVNQYPTVDGATLSYNANGCLTGDGTWTFTFDTENHLLTANKSGTSVTNLYDPLHRQREHQVVDSLGTTKNRYIYSGWQRIEDYGGATGTTITQRYVYGTSLDETLIRVNVAAGTLTYMHQDYIGSVIALSDPSGAVTNRYTYSPWGESPSLTGTTHGYTGQRFEPESGLYYYKRRYYSPKLGRFLQPDQLTQLNLRQYAANGSSGCGCRCELCDSASDYQSGSNAYLYVTNDPLNLVDPSGLYAAPPVITTPFVINPTLLGLIILAGITKAEFDMLLDLWMRRRREEEQYVDDKYAECMSAAKAERERRRKQVNDLYKKCPPKTKEEDDQWDREHQKINEEYKARIAECADIANNFPYTPFILPDL